MLSRFTTTLLVALLVVVAAGCKKDTTTNPVDTEAPVLTFTTPAQSDTVGVESVAISVAATDNVGVQRVEIYLDGSTTPASVLTTTPWAVNLPITSLTDGAHVLVAKGFDAAGNVGTSAPRTFIKAVKIEDVVRRMSLIEIITSANCAPCAPANEYLRTNIEVAPLAGRVIPIKYHAPIPRSTDSLWKVSQTWGRPRMTYLFAPTPFDQGSAPSAWVNGKPVLNVAAEWVNQLTTDLTLAPDAKIELSKTINGSTITLTIKATGLMSAPLTDLRLHTVITESNIHYNDGNAEQYHYEVMRRMLPDADGETITLAKGETKTFTRTIEIDPRWNQSNCDAVVFIQSLGTKYVLQAATTPLH